MITYMDTHTHTHTSADHADPVPFLRRRIVFELTPGEMPLLEAAERKHGSKRLALVRALEASARLDELETALTAATAENTRLTRQLKNRPAPPAHDTPARRESKPKTTRTTRTRDQSGPAGATADLEEEIRSREAARILGLKTCTVTGYIRSDRLPGRHDNRKGWLTTRRAVAQYAARRKAAPSLTAAERGSG